MLKYLRVLFDTSTYIHAYKHEKSIIYQHKITKEYAIYGLGEIRHTTTLDEAIELINMLYKDRRVLYNLHCKEHDLSYNLLHVQRQINMLD